MLTFEPARLLGEKWGTRTTVGGLKEGVMPPPPFNKEGHILVLKKAPKINFSVFSAAVRSLLPPTVFIHQQLQQKSGLGYFVWHWDWEWEWAATFVQGYCNVSRSATYLALCTKRWWWWGVTTIVVATIVVATPSDRWGEVQSELIRQSLSSDWG